jgi:polyisoprenoid-binding protein YceI
MAQQSIVAVVPEETTWHVNNNHSTIRFFVNNFFRIIEGRFEVFNGSIAIGNDLDLTKADINFSILVRSLNSGKKWRDKRFLKPSFLNAAKFPIIHFKSFSLERYIRNRYIMEGSCTIRGVTKVVLFRVAYHGKKEDDLGNELTIFEARGKIRRHDFGLRWNKIIDVFIGEEVNVVMNIECM